MAGLVLKQRAYLLLFLIGIIAVGFLSAFAAHAQQAASPRPRILLTWQARSFAPSEYLGKVLPGPGSTISASVEIIDQGKVADLSQYPVYWYLDGDFVTGEAGKKNVNLKLPNRASHGAEVRVEIPGYKGDTLSKTAVVQIAQPEAVIVVPYGGRAGKSAPTVVHGTPYFFNVTDPSLLRFYWTVNGQTASGTESRDLAVSVNADAPAGSAVNIEFIVQDPKQELYVGRANATLRVGQ